MKYDSCAVVPAAGRGTRLGLDTPKILAPILPPDTIWSVLRAKLGLSVDHIAVVMSPWGEPIFRAALTPEDEGAVSIAIQPTPDGMGDAVFRALPIWREAKRVVVVWGDQVNVSRDTIDRALALHAGQPRTAVIPIVRLEQPYVEYRFGENGLSQVLETREADVCAPGGAGDVGTFVLSTEGIEEAWDRFLATGKRGKGTGEINFLPFLPFLVGEGWSVQPLEVADAGEARGVNDADDLAFAARHLERLKAGRGIEEK